VVGAKLSYLPTEEEVADAVRLARQCIGSS
jgi:hypothetical protein